MILRATQGKAEYSIHPLDQLSWSATINIFQIVLSFLKCGTGTQTCNAAQGHSQVMRFSLHGDKRKQKRDGTDGEGHDRKAGGRQET